jgi:hypothetical protein
MRQLSWTAVPGGYSPNQAGTKFIKNVTLVQPAKP